ncbi:glycan-binding surface protein [Pontibacter akesuensis]|uniref:Surface glycan-binding protein B xyloglucan binding domain-containing protein n=1 Tax=Pontibacter akesuensis TaxID=388950 RepID=A0A1I7KXB4_9BACT|nr:glycan-binding surface protein [Pontibacter akesuensis]SFV02152.1 hypothetical protein SAMN04487941_0083 [Pontibacter akesuensis]
MRAFIKNVLLYIMPLMLGAGILSGCEDDDMPNGGNPTIHYVRVTDPAASDSLLVGSSLGNLIAIVGENLGGTREVWFNDRQAVLNPTYITDKTILVNVPSLPPTEVMNKMVLRFANGNELQHDFVIEISGPQITRIKNEHVKDGEELVLLGEYFFDPIKVTFAGGEEAEVVSVAQNEVRVIVPEGATPGPITVQTNFGKATSSQWFRDTRNVFSDMDVSNTGGWWHGHQYFADSHPNVKPLDGKFILINKDLGAGEWFEFMVANPPSSMQTQNIPDDAIRNPSNYNLKFEINTIKPLVDGTVIKMYIGNDMPGQRGGMFYAWKPNIDTKGQWETVSIPFENIIGITNPQVSANGYGVSFWFQDGVAMTANFAVDNFRVTPK